MNATGDAGDHRRPSPAREGFATTMMCRRINRRALEIAAAFDVANDEDMECQFLCECGCLERVQMKPSEYARQGGALLDGHRPDGR